MIPIRQTRSDRVYLLVSILFERVGADELALKIQESGASKKKGKN